ncbi:unnamed protein product [Parnassius apollo]|uniref:Heme oxygenase n=1 Tax=Parnassius apollo TaxID=110799 RepID=A0A8S3W124_PARAO|nr:unnamed protein product [Parnassius apollo]
MSEDNELFTTRVRRETRKIHSVSDALVNAKFAISLRDETVWCGGLFAFYHIFAFLEDVKERLNKPMYNKLFVNEVLFRKKAFEEDLTHYLGENWRSIEKSPTLQNYLGHLQYLENTNSILLMAYVYHLYLGLLSGGQILAKKRRIFFNKNTSRQHVYVDKVTNFGDVDVGKLKKDIHNAMNEVAKLMSYDEQLAFIRESYDLFLRNNSIVKSIEGQNKVIYNMLFKAFAVLMLIGGAIYAYKMYK